MAESEFRPIQTHTNLCRIGARIGPEAVRGFAEVFGPAQTLQVIYLRLTCNWTFELLATEVSIC